MIDSDSVRYPKEVLQVWKQLAEQNAILEVEAVSPELSSNQDMEMIKFYVQCFDPSGPFKMIFIKKEEWKTLIRQ